MGEPKNWLARMADTAANTEINPLTLAWRMLPPNARKAYASLPSAVAEMSPGAAVRDTVAASGETTNALAQGRGWDAASGAVNMLAAAAGVLPGSRLITKGAKELAQPIRAYHGSPHDFDKFDLSKIGTGEGAQAYGHGLYFAENEGVAKRYRDALSTRPDAPSTVLVGPDGRQLDILSAPGELSAIRGMRDEISYDQLLKDAQANLDRAAGLRNPQLRDPQVRRAQDAVDWLRSNNGVAFTANPERGRMYEVNIHADPNKFLDWDKPLSQQGEPVKSALGVGASGNNVRYENGRIVGEGPLAQWSALNRSVVNDAQARKVADNWLNGGAMTGAQFYESSKLVPGPHRDKVAATETLRNLGIPGIKYLDGGSRAAGQGSSNYVAFDDKMIEILRKYGLLPAAAGGAAVGVNAFAPNGGESY